MCVFVISSNLLMFWWLTTYFFLSKELPIYSGSSLTSFLAKLSSLQDLSSLRSHCSPSRDWTCAPCSGSMESQPLARQVTPHAPLPFWSSLWELRDCIPGSSPQWVCQIKHNLGEFSGCLMVRILHFHWQDWGLVPGWGTEMPQLGLPLSSQWTTHVSILSLSGVRFTRGDRF